MERGNRGALLGRAKAREDRKEGIGLRGVERKSNEREVLVRGHFIVR